MSPAEAALVIGCTAHHVRHLIKTGQLKATKKKSRHNQIGYEYHITKTAAQGYHLKRRRAYR